MNQKPTIKHIRLTLSALVIGIMFGTETLAAEAKEPSSSSSSSTQPVFAKVGDIVITWRDYNNAYSSVSRNRFYHGKPPEAEVAALQREIGDKLVTDALLLNEAKRIKLKPDAEAVKQKVDAYDQQNSSSEEWKNVRDRAIPVITKRYENENVLKRLEEQTRKVPAPSDKQLRAYYESNPEKFTEPEQLRVSVILLSVDPGIGDFDTQRKKAEEFIKQLNDGADFAEMAKKYSGDLETVNNGGDMGYLHGGMLSEMSQQAVDKLKPGEISDPVGLMEGIGIFKLTDRKPAKLNSYNEVKERARELYMADEGDRAWKSLIAQLKKKMPVKVDESQYLPLPKPTQNAISRPAAQDTKTPGESATTK